MGLAPMLVVFRILERKLGQETIHFRGREHRYSTLSNSGAQRLNLEAQWSGGPRQETRFVFFMGKVQQSSQVLF